MSITASGQSISEAGVALKFDLHNVKEWLSATKLNLNIVKIEYLLISSQHNVNN